MVFLFQNSWSVFLQFARHMTVPLLGMVGELLRRQEEMARLLANKDKEIDDYKSQGGRVSRSEWTITFLYVSSLTLGDVVFISEVW